MCWVVETTLTVLNQQNELFPLDGGNLLVVSTLGFYYSGAEYSIAHDLAACCE
jgi:hypothetical protein